MIQSVFVHVYKPFECTSTSSLSPKGPRRLTNPTAFSNMCLFTQYTKVQWLNQVWHPFKFCNLQTIWHFLFVCVGFDLNLPYPEPNQAWLPPENFSLLLFGLTQMQTDLSHCLHLIWQNMGIIMLTMVLFHLKNQVLTIPVSSQV